MFPAVSRFVFDFEFARWWEPGRESHHGSNSNANTNLHPNTNTNSNTNEIAVTDERTRLTMRILACLCLIACASAAPRPEASVDYAALVSAPDRSDRDKARDQHRKPVEMLQFFAPAPGMKVAEVGAGGGYSTELFARAVGATGKVFAQDTPNWAGEGLTKAWVDRLARPVMQNTQHFMRQWDDPLPPEASGLDAVYSVAIYHDVINEKSDVNKLNAAVFAALKPGGSYFIIDNTAKDGSGAQEVGNLHRIDEKLVREQVQAAGFKLAGEAQFLRNAKDTRDWNADPDAKLAQSHTHDRFALRFVKPG